MVIFHCYVSSPEGRSLKFEFLLVTVVVLPCVSVGSFAFSTVGVDPLLGFCGGTAAGMSCFASCSSLVVGASLDVPLPTLLLWHVANMFPGVVLVWGACIVQLSFALAVQLAYPDLLALLHLLSHSQWYLPSWGLHNLVKGYRNHSHPSENISLHTCSARSHSLALTPPVWRVSFQPQ